MCVLFVCLFFIILFRGLRVTEKNCFVSRLFIMFGKSLVFHDRVARGVARGTSIENEHVETHEAFHTEVAWHLAFATCDPRAMARLDALFFPLLTCDLPPRTVNMV